jgi:ribosomal protein L22
MSSEDEKDPKAQTPPAAKKPAAKKARTKKPAAKAAAAKADDADAPAEKKPAAKTAAAKKPARKEPAAKEPIASEAAKPARSKDAAKPARRRVVRAHARYVRTSARKARMVCGHLRGKTVGEARAILAFTPRDVARDWSKLLESAVANAESNHELLEDELIVREAYADEGPTIKRFRPRAMGRATPIRKRTSHLTITLTPGAAARTTKRNG